jgi:hypothetical protein
MRVIENTAKAATEADIAVLEFKAVKELRKLPKEKRQSRTFEMTKNVNSFAQVAIEILAQEKDELIETVRTKYDIFGPALMGLHHAGVDAKALHGMIQAAEIRLASALGVVEGFEPEKPAS